MDTARSTRGGNLQQIADSVVPEACEDLLRSIGRPGKRQERPEVAPLIQRAQEYAAGVIQFAGEAMSGSVVFVSDFFFFAEFLPSAGRAKRPTPASPADWLRVRDLSMELANQLLGRIKNQLCRAAGIVVEPTLPRAASDHALRVVLRERTEAPYAYAAGGHGVFVWFSATTKQGTLSMPTPEQLIGEGDFVEF